MIYLDRLQMSDAPAVAAAMPHVGDMLSAVPANYTTADALDYITRIAGPDEYAIRVDGALAGTIRAGGDIGYWVAPEYQRQGVGRRAAILALSRSFEDHEVVTAGYFAHNAPSGNMLKSLGFIDPEAVQIPSVRLGPQQGWRLRLTRARFAQLHAPRLTTARTTIAPITPEDLPDLHRIATDPRVAQWLLSFAPNGPRADSDAQHRAYDGRRPYRLAVRAGGRVIGAVGFGAGARMELYYYFDPEVWGQGYAREAVTAAVAEARLRHDAPLIAAMFDGNPASARILETLGLRPEGRVTLTSRARGEATATAYS